MADRKADLDLRWKMRKKLFKTKSGGEDEKTWRKRKLENKDRREAQLLEQLRLAKQQKENGESTKKKKANKKGASEEAARSRPFSVSIAVPGSFLNMSQSAELRAYTAGQIARAATLFRVSEVIVYDETARMTDKQVETYWAGSWYGDVPPSDSNLESNFILARILEYLECPQYLRKALFWKQRALQFAGLLNPLDAQHHLKSNDMETRFREGVILDKPVKAGRGPLIDVGLEKELQIETETPLPPGTRVTVQMGPPETDSGKRFRGQITSAKKVAEQTGLYWGYSVRIAKGIREVIDRHKFDYIFATSPKGGSAAEVEISTLINACVLVVFSSVAGIDAAIEADESYEETSAENAVDSLICPVLGSGSRSSRMEEDVLLVLGSLDARLCQLYGFSPSNS